MSSLPKPVLRGHFKRQGIRLLIRAVGFGAISGALYHYLCGVPRKRAYEDFLKTYDADAHMKDLINWGYMRTPESMKQKLKEAMQ